MNNIWQFQSTLIRRLLLWSQISMISGLLLQFIPNRFVRSLGQQFTAWGFVDALIAIFGKRTTEKRYSQLSDPLSAEIIESETQKLSEILRLNTALDVGYVTGGLILTFFKGKNHSSWRGHGIGVIIQGGFLFFFDLFHIRQMRKPQQQAGAQFGNPAHR